MRRRMSHLRRRFHGMALLQFLLLRLRRQRNAPRRRGLVLGWASIGLRRVLGVLLLQARQKLNERRVIFFAIVLGGLNGPQHLANRIHHGQQSAGDFGG